VATKSTSDLFTTKDIGAGEVFFPPFRESFALLVGLMGVFVVAGLLFGDDFFGGDFVTAIGKFFAICGVDIEFLSFILCETLDTWTGTGLFLVLGFFLAT